MALVTVKIIGTTPLLYGKQLDSVKESNEKSDDFEERCWQERAHFLPDRDTLFIPGLAIKRMLEWTSKYRGEKIGRKGLAQLFESGVAVLDDMPLNKTRADIIKHRKFVPSDGKSQGGSRVFRNFPMIMPPWTGTVKIQIIDGRIDRGCMERHLMSAGTFCGLGTWSPRKKGMHGRFTVSIVSWLRDEWDPPARADEDPRPKTEKRAKALA